MVQRPAEPPEDSLGAGEWTKSSYSNGSCTCVEVALGNGGNVLIRDSKYLLDPHNDLALQPIIVVPAIGWIRTIDALLAEETDDPSLPIAVHLPADGSMSFSCRATGIVLRFNPDETVAFRRGIAASELRPEALLRD